MTAWITLRGGPCDGQRLRASGLAGGWRGPMTEVWACRPAPYPSAPPGPWYRYVLTSDDDVYAYAGASRRGW